MRALVADDYLAIREDNADTLRGMGFDVVEADSGFDVYRKLGLAMWPSSRPFDILVLDNTMPPGLKGVDIVRDLRANGNRTPVVLVTADLLFQDEGPPTLCRVLRKPFRLVQLQRVVREMVPGLEPVS